jgi:hypothetical protein
MNRALSCPDGSGIKSEANCKSMKHTESPDMIDKHKLMIKSSVETGLRRDELKTYAITEAATSEAKEEVKT